MERDINCDCACCQYWKQAFNENCKEYQATILVLYDLMMAEGYDRAEVDEMVIHHPTTLKGDSE